MASANPIKGESSSSTGRASGTSPKPQAVTPVGCVKGSPFPQPRLFSPTPPGFRYVAPPRYLCPSVGRPAPAPPRPNARGEDLATSEEDTDNLPKPPPALRLVVTVNAILAPLFVFLPWSLWFLTNSRTYILTYLHTHKLLLKKSSYTKTSLQKRFQMMQVHVPSFLRAKIQKKKPRWTKKTLFLNQKAVYLFFPKKSSSEPYLKKIPIFYNNVPRIFLFQKFHLEPLFNPF